MKAKFAIVLLTCVAASIALQIAACSRNAAANASAELKVGSEAPAFTLKDTSGNEHSLSDYKGKFVVLEWFNNSCPFVKKHYTSGSMQKLQQEYTGKEVVWLSINSSAPGKQGHVTAETAPKTISEWNMEATKILLDHDGKVGKMYGAKTTPHMFVIDKRGKLVYQGAIDSRPTPNTADLVDAQNYVKVALDNTMAGKRIENTSTKPYGCSVKY
jgi:peroxiredoxin